MVIEVISGNLLNTAELVAPTECIELLTADPTDNKVLECACECNADYIVTGDRHLLDLKEFRGIKIVRPAEFLRLFKRP